MKTIASVLFIAMILGSTIAIADSSDVPSVFVLPNHTIITNAALAAHIDPVELLAVATCESSMNPKATNGASFGILQFVPSTFQIYARKLHISDPDIWNVSQQARIAAYMFANGQERQWSCFTILAREGKI